MHCHQSSAHPGCSWIADAAAEQRTPLAPGWDQLRDGRAAFKNPFDQPGELGFGVDIEGAARIWAVTQGLEGRKPSDERRFWGSATVVSIAMSPIDAIVEELKILPP